MAKILGLFMMSIPFIFTIVLFIKLQGLKSTLIGISLTLLAVGLILGGSYLAK